MQSDPVRLFVENWRQMTGRLPSSHYSEHDGIAACFADVPTIFFNLWVQTSPAADAASLEQLLQQGAQRAALSDQPAGAILWPDWCPPDWEAATQKAGLASVFSMTAMEAAAIVPPRRLLPDIEIRQVADDQGAQDIALVNALAYEMQPEELASVANAGFWHGYGCGFVGYIRGEPVAAAAALPACGTVYIAMVATVPGFQGKGYADAVMRRAIAEGQRSMGIKRVTLHATAVGRPLYETMGFAAGRELVLLAADH